MPGQDAPQKQSMMASARQVYSTNRIVKFCTNGTVILGFLAALWQGGAWAAGQIDGYFAKASDVSALQTGYSGVAKEQQEQRSLLEQQSRQLNFIYYDAMKREKSNIEREIFELRARARTAVENARLEQLVEDLRDLKNRIREQENVIRGRP